MGLSDTMRRCDTFIHVPDSMLTFDLKVKFIVFCHVCMFDMIFCLLWHWHTIFGTWVYHHERMCQVHSWSWYNIDLWLQGQIYRVYDMSLCSGLSFFVLWYGYTLFGTWVYHHSTLWVHSWTLWPWPSTSISKLYFHHGFESVKISLLFDIGIPNFGIWVYHHETTCCVHFLPLYDLDLWPICGWQGILS